MTAARIPGKAKGFSLSNEEEHTMQFVTGATGHIGNVLVRQLLARGERVRVLVRHGRPLPALEGLDVEIVWGDLLDYNSLVQAVRGVNRVYHLAARISLNESEKAETEHVNLEGTRNLAQPIESIKGLSERRPMPLRLCQFCIRLANPGLRLDRRESTL